MPGSRRKNYRSFRDVAKQGASHFEVGYRSQRDPILADSEASEHVLVPKESSARESRLEEQRKYGVYFEDEYDYLQHLRDVNEIHDSEMRQLPDFQMKEDDDAVSVSMASTTASSLLLPSSALGSTVEREVGLLNMAAATAESTEDWDPEVLAALDDNFDFDDPDNVLADDFMQMANTEGGSGLEEEEDFVDESGDDEEDLDTAEEEEAKSEEEDERRKGDFGEKTKDLTDWLQGMELQREADEEEGEGSDVASMEGDAEDAMSEWTDDCAGVRGDLPRVSKYSAAMVPRNENLQFIDKLTEALIEREYSWDKMGALEGEELSGRVTFDSDLFKQAYNEMLQREKKVTMKDLFNSEERVRPVIPEPWKYVEEKDYSVEEEIDYTMEPLVSAKKPEFDAQSILSTYSRTRNLPTNIVIPEEWKKKKKQKAEVPPADAGAASSLPGLTLKDLEQESRLERLADAPPTYRAKTESVQEKKERKQAVKAHQKERRTEKKLNKLAFRGELQQQRKVKEAGTAQKRVISYQS